ncbi:NADPH-dependent F420 reductase [Actinoplanes sp. NPDC051494]|uniref:NADPH-dependent F420 reductase n=1 Tax=Actinoplanes sp. NPDC051494 TaxID=3363907 RepID=UPI0037A09290
MTTVGFIGSGHIGGTVARLAVAAGYDVVLSNSRGPASLAGLVAELGPGARAATTAEAAAAGEFVVLSVPFKAHADLSAAELTGKLVLDTSNYYPQRDGHVAELHEDVLTSSEITQRQLPGSTVVKVFNTITFMHLAELHRPAGDPDRTALTIAGDDADAKQTVTAFLDAIGYDAVDVGPLAQSWRVEPGQPAYAAPFGVYGKPGTPAGVDALMAAVAQAKR